MPLTSKEPIYLEVDPGRFLISRSANMQRAWKLIARAAPTDTTVLITGEPGTGKELVARLIHKLSPRAAREFVAALQSLPPDHSLRRAEQNSLQVFCKRFSGPERT